MPNPRTLILVSGAETFRELTGLAETLPWARERSLAFDVITGEIESAVCGHRDREPETPLCFIAADERGALSALSGGADEAVVYHAFDGPSLAALVDRVELRARRRLETQRLHLGFAHTEKLTALGTLVAGIGHEINNPLSVVLLCVDAARRQLLPALDAAEALARAVETNTTPRAEDFVKLRAAFPAAANRRDGSSLLDDMSSAVNSIASIVRDLRVFARADDEELPEIVDARELVDNVLRLLTRDLSRHGVVERDYAGDLPHLVVPRNRVTQVLMNVLINASHAIAEVERPVHRVRISIRSDEEFVAIAVSDTGPGIPQESLERIFDPFFTTKRQELGTGLGLSISRSILRKLKGDITAESVFGEGATFVCFLPIPTRETIREAWRLGAAGAQVVSQTASRTVLIVDDDSRMLRAYARLLNADHRIVIAQGGREAIELLESGSEANLAVVELDLVDGEGPKLLSWISKNRPELSSRILVMASADAEPRYSAFLEGYGGPILRKPARGDALLAAVGALLDPLTI